MLNLILNWLLWTWSHWPDKNHLEANILHAFWGGGAEVTYYWSDQRGIMVILRRARPPASAPTSNESWLALAGFVSNQLSGGQFNEEKLSSQPARNTACKLQHREFYILVECFRKGASLRLDNRLLSLCSPRLSIVTVLRQIDIYYAVSSPMWILVAMVKAAARTFTR